MSVYGFGLLMEESTGDLDITGGDFHFLENTEDSLRQRIALRLNTWKGEWPYNEEFGLPVQKIMALSGLTGRAQIEAEFVAQINLEPDVTSIKNFQTEFDPTTRTVKLTRIEVYHDDEPYTLSLVNPDATKYSYPVPVESTISGFCNYGEDLVEALTDLHPLIHEEMIITGDKTWWNKWVSLNTNTQYGGSGSQYGRVQYTG